MKYISIIMTIKKNLSLNVLDSKQIQNFNNIIREYGIISRYSSSHIYFDTQPIDLNDISYDITFFQLEAENKSDLDEKMKDMVETFNQTNIDYGLRDEDTGEMLVHIDFIAALDIKFDNIKIIKKGTYEKIDKLKKIENEFGTCKGYKPDFRPLEEHPINDLKVNTESIYLFCHSKENMIKLKNLLIEKVSEIDSNLKVDFRIFADATQ